MNVISFSKNQLVRKTLLALLSGALLSLAYGVPTLWFLGFVALVPLLYVLKNTLSRKKRFWWSFFTGMLYYGSVFSFLFSAHPITWAGIQSPATSLVFILCVWLSSVALFSLFMGIWGVASNKMSQSVGSAVTLASLWVLIEWTQALSLSLMWWETNGLTGAHWTLGHIGYTLAEFPLLLSLSSLGGVYILSFVVIFINGLIFRLILTNSLKKQVYRELVFSLLFLILLSAGLFAINGHARDNARVARIASFYTTYGPDFFTVPESEAVKNMQMAGLFDSILYEKENPELILLPENSEYLASLSAEKRKELVRRMSTEHAVIILDSRYSHDIKTNHRIGVLEFETGSDDTQSYTKRLLVPGGEYMPRIVRMLGDLTLEKNWNEHFEEYLSISRGNETEIGEHGDLRIGALFCSEVLTPTLYRESTRMGANVLVNTASHSVLNSSEHIYNQVVKFSKTRAAENNRFFIQSGNSVPSFVINNHGQLLGETARDKNAILYADVSLVSNTTLASKAGEWWIMLFFLISLVSLVTKRMREGGE